MYFTYILINMSNKNTFVWFFVAIMNKTIFCNAYFGLILYYFGAFVASAKAGAGGQSNVRC